MTAESDRVVVPTDPEPGVRQGRPGAALIAWLVQRHGRRFSGAALEVAMPATKALSTPEDVARALEVFDLESRLVTVAPHKLDPGALPCVLFRKDGTTAVLIALAPRGRRATVLDPERGSMETEMTRGELGRDFAPKVLLVSKSHAAARGPASPEAREDTGRARDWFWRPIRETRAAWMQILIAALCLTEPRRADLRDESTG